MPEKLRILHLVTNADLGGAPRVVTELAKSAIAAGHACAVASMPNGPLWEHLDQAVERRPLAHIRREINPREDLACLFEIRALYREWRPDVVHLHSSKMGVLGRLAARMAGKGLWKRTIYTIHGFDTILKAHRIFLPLERLLAKSCAAVVPISPYDGENLATHGIKAWTPLVENGVSDRSLASDAELCSSPAGEKAFRLIARSREEGARVVLSIARLAPPKRFDLYVELARALPAAHFFWIGNPPDADLAPFGPLPQNLCLLGEIPEAGNFARLCDLFVLLSDYEGLPMSILEALSSAKPVVASTVGGIAAAIDDSVGTLVPNEPKAITQAVEALLAAPDILQSKSRAARTRWEERFSVTRMWEKYAELYRQITDDTPRNNHQD